MANTPVKTSLVNTNELSGLGDSARVRTKSSSSLTSTQVLNTAKGILGVEMILDADSWTNSKTYSFESIYPSSSYDVVISPNLDDMSEAQKTMWDNARIYGTDEGELNVITAQGVVPTQDLPVVIQFAPVGSYL